MYTTIYYLLNFTNYRNTTVSKIGSYLIEAEENGELRYDERNQRYVKPEDFGFGGQHSPAERPKRDRRKTSFRDERVDE